MILKLYTLLATLRIALLSKLTSANSDFTFEPENFVENLKYMGLGMLAIFIVIGIIVGITYLLNTLFKEGKK